MKNYLFASYMMENTVTEMRLYDLLRMTHLNISFAHVKEGGNVSVEHLSYLSWIGYYKKVNPQLKVILSIGGWGADGFSQAAMTEEGRRTFVQTSLEILKKWNFDGIDIDWEYPCSDQAGIAYDPADKHNFTLLMKALREGLDQTQKGLLLTVAVGGEQYYIDGTEMDQISQYVDYVNLMTYDLRGGFTKTAGHHTNLFPQTGEPNGPSSERTIALFHQAGVPYEKMVLGSAFYGRKWDGISDPGDHFGLGQEASTAGVGHANFDLQDEEAIKRNGYTRYWDDQAKAPYLFNGRDFISYEDPVSLKYKCDFIKNKGLAGLMYWAYGNPPLFDTVAHELIGYPLLEKKNW